MSATEDLLSGCLGAITEERAPGAVAEVVERAVRDKRFENELSDEPTVRTLYRGEDLTILHVVIPKRRPGAGRPIPHDHRMWAVVGIVHGAEDNEFFRRSTHSIDVSGGRVLAEGEVVAMGRETIHAVTNPSSDALSSALHVYGGDLIGAQRSMWCEPDLLEQPYDFARVARG